MQEDLVKLCGQTFNIRDIAIVLVYHNPITQPGIQQMNSRIHPLMNICILVTI